jgi:hypothetical protein
MLRLAIATALVGPVAGGGSCEIDPSEFNRDVTVDCLVSAPGIPDERTLGAYDFEEAVNGDCAVTRLQSPVCSSGLVGEICQDLTALKTFADVQDADACGAACEAQNNGDDKTLADGCCMWVESTSTCTFRSGGPVTAEGAEAIDSMNILAVEKNYDTKAWRCPLGAPPMEPACSGQIVRTWTQSNNRACQLTQVITVEGAGTCKPEETFGVGAVEMHPLFENPDLECGAIYCHIHSECQLQPGDLENKQCACKEGWTGDGVDCRRLQQDEFGEFTEQAVCGDDDIFFFSSPSGSRRDGGYLLQFEYDTDNFLQENQEEEFEGLSIRIGSCMFTHNEEGLKKKEECHDANENPHGVGDNTAYSQGSMWDTEVNGRARTPSGTGGDCNTVYFRSTLNNLVESCGFTSEDQPFINNPSDVSVTILAGLVRYRTTTVKYLRGAPMYRCYERSTVLAIKLGTNIRVRSQDTSVFGFAINQFAVLETKFDSLPRQIQVLDEDSADGWRPVPFENQLGEDLTMKFVTSVQYPYILRSKSFIITDDLTTSPMVASPDWAQQLVSSTGTGPNAEPPALKKGSANMISLPADQATQDHELGKVLEIARACTPEDAVCEQTWEVIVARKSRCAWMNPLELNTKFNADFHIGCQAGFTGKCVIASEDEWSGYDQAQRGLERYITNFVTNSNNFGANADEEGDKNNRVTWTTESDNYCTRVLADVPLEGSLTVYDSATFDQAQEQFVFGSRAYVKVRVHARTAISHVHLERLRLEHTQVLEEGQEPTFPTKQLLHYDIHSENEEFGKIGDAEPTHRGENFLPAKFPTYADTYLLSEGEGGKLPADEVLRGYVGVKVSDSGFRLRNDELNSNQQGGKAVSRSSDINEDDDDTVEELNQGQVTFDFLWNEHTSPAGSASEDVATTTLISVDVRVQFRAAGRRSVRRLLQEGGGNPSFANPGVRTGASVGLSKPKVVAAASTTKCSFAFLLSLCAAAFAAN